MPRTIKPEEHAEKRKEILGVVRQLIYTKGYEQMTIQDILAALKISKGAFYHYFDSKPALLEALLEQMMKEAEAIYLPLVQDENLSAVEKFRAFFSNTIAWKVDQKAFVVALLRVWFSDENAIVRQKLNVTLSQRIAPLFSEIIYQGIEEGVFSSQHPTQAGEVILTILVGLQNHIATLMFETEEHADTSAQNAAIVATYAGFVDSMERIIGAPKDSLYRISAEEVQVWIDALKAFPPAP